MVDKNKLIKVSNRDSGSVGYQLPELRVIRNFQKGETKEISMDELRQLSYIPGGQVILNECLIIHDQEALAELLPECEPEYFYTEEDIKNLLLTGTMDQFMDCLDFAPGGVIDILKNLAVDLKVNDLAKRQAILEKTGFNVTKAIEINEASEVVEEAPQTTRRAAPITETAKKETTSAPARRTAAPATSASKYSVKK